MLFLGSSSDTGTVIGLDCVIETTMEKGKWITESLDPEDISDIFLNN